MSNPTPPPADQPVRPSREGVTDTMCEALVDALKPDRIQGFQYGDELVIRDVWLPDGKQVLWRAPADPRPEGERFSPSGPQHDKMMRRCEIERARLGLAAALADPDTPAPSLGEAAMRLREEYDGFKEQAVALAKLRNNTSTYASGWDDGVVFGLDRALEIVSGEHGTALSRPSPVAHEDGEVGRLRDVVSRLLTWADKKCPCENEQPNPCPLCGASVENLEPCKAADQTLPRDLLAAARAALPGSPS
ncbi:hypothetical protein [Roseomonas indoligenes]|uniref:Uncharacterized protein n=1 Tax=Roseomonas indoligenes TaxID=2820811 RepID=A0A940S4R3_9PROT|nr:hypothetical protein [Pararoseomonas indoligenes]MBP0492220.1 hypothetical protein [Pararoseomonas indoligenes]